MKPSARIHELQRPGVSRDEAIILYLDEQAAAPNGNWPTHCKHGVSLNERCAACNALELGNPAPTPSPGEDKPRPQGVGLASRWAGIAGDYAGQIELLTTELAEAQAELTRASTEIGVKADRIAELLNDSQRLEEELTRIREELAWEKAWDLHRKRAMGAAVESARYALDFMHPQAVYTRNLRAALFDLEQPTQPEPPSEREIVFSACEHSSYRCRICSARVELPVELPVSDPTPTAESETP